MKASVLNVIGRHFLLALDLDADLQANSTGHGRLVRSLLQIVPHVHLAAERAHLDDGLAQKVVGLARQLLHEFRSYVVVFVPHAHFDAIARVVALT